MKSVSIPTDRKSIKNSVEKSARCTECGNKVTFWRVKGKKGEREKNHKKHLFCFECQRTTLHIEK